MKKNVLWNRPLPGQVNFKTILSNIQYLSLVRLPRKSMYYLSLVELTPWNHVLSIPGGGWINTKHYYIS